MITRAQRRTQPVPRWLKRRLCRSPPGVGAAVPTRSTALAVALGSLIGGPERPFASGGSRLTRPEKSPQREGRAASTSSRAFC